MTKALLKYVKNYKKSTFLSILFAAMEVVTDITIPLLMAAIIDKGIEAGNISQIYLYGGIMILFVLIGLFSGAASGKFAANASSGFARNLRDAMFVNIQDFSFSNIDKFSTAGLVTRMTTDVTNVQNSYQMVIRLCVRAPLMLICALIMSVIIAPQVSIIFLIVIVFLSAALFLIIRSVMPIFTKVFKGYDKLNANVQENVTGIRVVKGFVREKFENEKFISAVDNLYKKFVKAEGRIVLNNPIMMLAIYSCILAVSWMGAHLIVGGSLTTGELTSLFTYIMSILMNLMMISMLFVMITISMSSAKRITEVLSEETDIKNPENPVMEVKDGSVEFKHVDFTYKKDSVKNVLDDINFTISSGETIGIIGSTGSSKTSLVSLISRLYDVNNGSVSVGGLDVRKYDLKVLRDEVAVVLQKNELFSGTILENLRWGNKEATYEECVAACEMACADDFIQAFPDKYETYIEQGGTNVSGGQKQRLCIARALLKRPKILILDDSTSAVDTATDARIRRAFLEEIPHTTKFIIAQRISSVKDADRIIVLDDGKINDIGVHQELIKTNKIYSTIYENQRDGSGDFDQKGAM